MYDEFSCPMPIITLEVLTENSNHTTKAQDIRQSEIIHTTIQAVQDKNPPIHYLTVKTLDELGTRREAKATTVQESDFEEVIEVSDSNDSNKGKTDFLEYMTRMDGSVICKQCGEVLQSRTHWYRHKYKSHVQNQLPPFPLFQCEKCSLYFKSRKGKKI